MGKKNESYGRAAGAEISQGTVSIRRARTKGLTEDGRSQQAKAHDACRRTCGKRKFWANFAETSAKLAGIR